MDELSIIATGSGSSRLGYIGSVTDIIAGKISQTLEHKVFKARDYLCGFLLASPQNKYSLGESIIVNGLCYTTSTEKKSSNYNKTICGAKFLTSGVFLIPHEAKPSYKIKLNITEKALPLLDFYNRIYKQINHPLAFFGLVEFSDFHAIAIGKPPIDGMNIFANNKDYYPLPAVNTKNISAFIIGALTDYSQTQYENINKQLEVILYREIHPGDIHVSNPSITNHAHALTLKQPITTMNAITSQVVDKTLHVFIDGTRISRAELNVFTIQGLDNYQT